MVKENITLKDSRIYKDWREARMSYHERELNSANEETFEMELSTRESAMGAIFELIYQTVEEPQRLSLITEVLIHSSKEKSFIYADKALNSYIKLFKNLVNLLSYRQTIEELSYEINYMVSKVEKISKNQKRTA